MELEHNATAAGRNIRSDRGNDVRRDFQRCPRGGRYSAPKNRNRHRNEGAVASKRLAVGGSHDAWAGRAVDVEVHCDLHIPHYANQANVLRLKTSSTSFPFVPAGWERVVTVSMETNSLTEDFGLLELKKRLNELDPRKDVRDISSLRGAWLDRQADCETDHERSLRLGARRGTAPALAELPDPGLGGFDLHRSRHCPLL